MSARIVVPLLLILAGISWLAMTNIEKANYFFNVNELPEPGHEVYQSGLKIKGRVVPGTIDRTTKKVRFTIHEEDSQLNVVYVGESPLPDLFKDHAETVVEGRMNQEGVFEATHLQAKCGSKYEAMAPEVKDGALVEDGSQPKT